MNRKEMAREELLLEYAKQGQVVSRAVGRRHCHLCGAEIKKGELHVRVQGGTNYRNKTFKNICRECLMKVVAILDAEEAI